MGINTEKKINNYYKIYNSMVILDNNLNLISEYNKIKLVPFGEFLPLEGILKKIGLKSLTNNYQSFSRGEERKIINIEEKNFSLKILPLICYEIIYSGKLFDKADFDFIVNISEDGWFGDTSKTFAMPEASQAARDLVQHTQECLYLGIRAVADGTAYRRLNAVGAAIHDHADRYGYGVVRNFVGHGIGDVFHCEPNVVHYRSSGGGPALKSGHTFTIEPMISAGSHEVC